MSYSPHFPMRAGIHVPGVLAAALSLSATGALMVLFGVSHPPAGATTLIVSLGIIAQQRSRHHRSRGCSAHRSLYSSIA
jgi:hypothetical protein